MRRSLTITVLGTLAIRQGPSVVGTLNLRDDLSNNATMVIVRLLS